MNKRNVLHQSADLLGFCHGEFLGKETVADLLKHGNFGLGTFDHLDGELVLLDGEIYQVKSDGHVYSPTAEVGIPYSQVTFFRATQSFVIKQVPSFFELARELDSQLKFLKKDLERDNFAIRISGESQKMTVRSVCRQDPPYRTLDAAILGQAVFELEGMKGSFAGFRFCDAFLRGSNWPNYHFHFLSDDKNHGGHLLDLSIEKGTIEIMHLA